MAQQYDSIFAEVDEDVRRERLRALMKSVGRYVLAITAVILIGTVGIVVWQRYQEQKSQALTSVLVEAGQRISQNKTSEALPLLKQVAEANHPTLSVMARLWLGELLKDSAPAEAKEWLAPISGPTLKEDPYRQYSALVAGVAPAAGEAGAEDAKTDSGNVFAYSARENRAVALLMAGKDAEARPLFAALAEDQATPASMRERAELILSTRLAETQAPAPAAAPAPASATGQ